MTYSLVLEDSGEVPDDVDDTKDEPVFGAHGEVRTSRVTGDRRFLRCLGQESMHSRETADLVARRVYGEYKHEDDGEQNGGVCATRPRSGYQMPEAEECKHSLVAEESSTHPAYYDVDGNAERNQETRLTSHVRRHMYTKLTQVLTAMVFIPVKELTVAEPPRMSMEDTMTFVARPKNINTRCATVPHRAATISSQVWACGAFSLSLAAN